jgi:hypothetical protein
VAGEVLIKVEFMEIPAGRVGVEAGMAGSVVAHLAGQRTQQVADALLLLHTYIKDAHHHVATFSADALLAAAELAGGHFALEDLDAVLLVERHAGHLIETDQVVLATVAFQPEYRWD